MPPDNEQTGQPSEDITEEMAKARERIIAASLKLAGARMGGLDQRNDHVEMRHASDQLDAALAEYEQAPRA